MHAIKPPPLATQDVHIYICELNTSSTQLDYYRSLLSVDEISRAERFIMPAARDTFVISRGKLRHLLSQYTTLHNKEIRFCYTEKQKPYISTQQNFQNPIYFNISHSRNYIVHAIARTTVLGIDIEFKRKDRPIEALAERFYTSLEIQQLHGSANKIDTFYRLWSLKEAYLKSQGSGISGGLKSIEYKLSSHSSKPTLTVLNSINNNTHYHAEEIFIHKDYQSAIVCDLENPSVLLFKESPR